MLNDLINHSRCGCQNDHQAQRNHLNLPSHVNFGLATLLLWKKPNPSKWNEGILYWESQFLFLFQKSWLYGRPLSNFLNWHNQVGIISRTSMYISLKKYFEFIHLRRHDLAENFPIPSHLKPGANTKTKRDIKKQERKNQYPLGIFINIYTTMIPR